MAYMKWEKDDSVAILTMTNGENRHNLDFAKTLLRTLDEILDDTSVCALILTSNDEKNFSQGIDVAWMGERLAEKDNDSVKKFLYTMNDVFKKILLYPVPVIAAINGHAFGNGSILACACDFRFMRADRGYFCFPEIDLGIPFLPGMQSIVRTAIPQVKFNEMALTGKRCVAPELEESTVIVKACKDTSELMKEAMEYARAFVKKRGIFGEMKKRMNKAVIETIEKEDPECIEPMNIYMSN